MALFGSSLRNLYLEFLSFSYILPPVEKNINVSFLKQIVYHMSRIDKVPQFNQLFLIS